MSDDKCTCFDDNLKIIKEKIVAKIPEGSIDLAVNWEGYAYFMSGDYSPVNPKINYEYREPKKGGGHRKNLKKSQVSLTACFCCYCGRKLKKAEKTNED